MNFFKKIFKWVIGLFLLGFIGIIIFIQTVDFSISQETINETFENLTHQPIYKNLSFENRNIHYVSIGDTTKQSVLFVHGSPGTWDNFLDFLSDSSLLNNFHLIAVDRPGFGRSGIGKPERSLEKQAAAITSVLVHEKTSAILVGHSFGGPVITRMSIDSPTAVDGLILVAASVDPELEKTKWYQIPVHYKILSWILPELLYSTNEEILALKKELQKMMPLWKNITHPVSVIQGGRDNLVPAGNASFAKSMLKNAPVNLIEIDEMNHFVPWNRPNLIKNEIKEMVVRILEHN